jgi:MFS family permease
MEEFHITITQASGFIGTTVLVLGFANFLWVPLAENYGRRAVFIGSMIATLGLVIWHATTTSYHSYLGSCILDDLGSGPVETLFPMIITDLVSFNERGKFVTLYTTALFLSLMLSPGGLQCHGTERGMAQFLLAQRRHARSFGCR